MFLTIENSVLRSSGVIPLAIIDSPISVCPIVGDTIFFLLCFMCVKMHGMVDIEIIDKNLVEVK